MRRLARCGRPDLTATSEEQEKSKNDADRLFGTAEGKKGECCSEHNISARSVSARYSVATAQFGGCG
jgi:hypothetical protein